MTTADLIDLLRLMPPSAPVVVSIRQNVGPDGELRELDGFRHADPDTVMYSHGRVLVQLDE